MSNKEDTTSSKARTIDLSSTFSGDLNPPTTPTGQEIGSANRNRPGSSSAERRRSSATTRTLNAATQVRQRGQREECSWIEVSHRRFT